MKGANVAQDKDRALRLKWTQKAYDAGEGVYFRNTDRAMVKVEVAFYPKLHMYLIEDGQRRKITADELARDYQRLRL